MRPWAEKKTRCVGDVARLNFCQFRRTRTMGRSWRRIWQRFTRRWANAIWRWSNSPRWSKYRMERHREVGEWGRSGIRCAATRASKNFAKVSNRELPELFRRTKATQRL